MCLVFRNKQIKQAPPVQSQLPRVRGLIDRYERLTPEQVSAKAPEPRRAPWQRAPGQTQGKAQSQKQQPQQETQAGPGARQDIQRKREELAGLRRENAEKESL